jgi:hypothetical protein
MMAPGQRPLVGDLILVPWFPDQDRKIRIDSPNEPDPPLESKEKK